MSSFLFLKMNVLYGSDFKFNFKYRICSFALLIPYIIPSSPPFTRYLILPHQHPWCSTHLLHHEVCLYIFILCTRLPHQLKSYALIASPRALPNSILLFMCMTPQAIDTVFILKKKRTTQKHINSYHLRGIINK